MRIDKYLKVSRIIKRRAVANEAADESRVFVNGRPVKPSYDVKVNDIVVIKYFKREVTIKVLDVSNYAKKEDADKMYELISVQEVNRNIENK